MSCNLKFVKTVIDKNGKTWNIYLDKADVAATDLVEGYIEDEHYDMSDELYSELIDWLGDELIKDWEPVERTLVNRKVEDDKESWERYKEYNHITTGRGYGWGY